MDTNNIILFEQNKVDLLAYFHALEELSIVLGLDAGPLQYISYQELISLALHDATFYIRKVSLTTNKRN